MAAKIYVLVSEGLLCRLWRGISREREREREREIGRSRGRDERSRGKSEGERKREGNLEEHRRKRRETSLDLLFDFPVSMAIPSIVF